MAATGDKSRPGLRRSAELREYETASGRLVADALMIMRRNPLAKQIPRNQHDILTGSEPDGRAYTDGYDHTCNNWTSDAMAYPQTNPNGGPRACYDRPLRSLRPEHIVDFIASDPRMQQTSPHQYRGRRSPLLLCHQLTRLRRRKFSRGELY
jgi:hypothetical protein